MAKSRVAFVREALETAGENWKQRSAPAIVFNFHEDPELQTLPRRQGITPVVGFFAMPDGRQLRYAEFRHSSAPNGVITIAPGKGDTIRAYQRLANTYAHNGWHVFILEPHSQGGSARTQPDSQKIHVISFDTYRGDLAHFMKTAVSPHATPGRPVILLAHSMMAGAAIPGLKAAQFPIDGFIGMAPMIEAVRLPTKGLSSVKIRTAIRFLNKMGFGDKYVPGGGPCDLSGLSLENNPYSGHASGLRRLLEDWTPASRTATGDPTIAWVAAYYQNIKAIKAIPEGSITTPARLIIAEDEWIVRNDRIPGVQKKFAEGVCEVLSVPTRHCIHASAPQIIRDIVGHTNKLAENLPRRSEVNAFQM